MERIFMVRFQILDIRSICAMYGDGHRGSFDDLALSCDMHNQLMVIQFCWGPLSFCVALMITFQHPLRHPLQALVSLGQIYGDILYYATSMFDHYHKGVTYCRPEAYYFWGYYVFMNFIWIVIPGCKYEPSSQDRNMLWLRFVG